MAESSKKLTFLEAHEVQLPRLPWKRLQSIREYASALTVPGVAELEKSPKTRIGLMTLADAREEYDLTLRHEKRVEELTASGLTDDQARQMSVIESFAGDQPELTLFDKGEE